MPERKIKYETLDHKADTGFLIKAPSLERLYIDSALALTDLLVKLERIQDIDKRQISIEAENRESLMVRWLNEILYLFDQQKYLCRRIVFDSFDGKKIKATLWGETYNAPKHGSISEIKAVTYHQLEVAEGTHPESHFYARIFLT